MRTLALSALATLLLSMPLGVAHAQMPNCVGRPDFDACMAAPVARMQQQNAMSQQALYDNYVRQRGPWLQRQWDAQGRPGTFPQFVYWMMMTAEGTNVQGGLDAQNRWFAGQQGAHNTQVEGGRDLINGMIDNSNRAGNAVERFDRQSIQGLVPQVDPDSGQVVQLPNSAPADRPFTLNGQTYVQNNTGYYRWNGNGWSAMQPGE